MLAFSTKCKVAEVGLGIASFNNYKYKVIKVDAGGINGMYAYIRMRDEVAVGDCLDVSACILTSYKSDTVKTTLALRLEQFTKVDPEEFEPLKKLRVVTNGIITKTERSVMRRVGPSGTSLCHATLRVYNENRKIFHIFLVGFCSGAKKVNAMEHDRFADVKGIIRRSVDRPDQLQLNVENFQYTEKEKEE